VLTHYTDRVFEKAGLPLFVFLLFTFFYGEGEYSLWHADKGPTVIVDTSPLA
jgi:hypothetical protein